jgi:hypothetical protein
VFDEPYEPAPEVWGVGWVGDRPWAVSEADIADETEVSAGHLRALGVGAGDLVLLVFTLTQTLHGAPLERAAAALGARFSCADATEGDAFRVEALSRLLQPKAVVGVDEAVIAGLADPAAALGSVPVVATADGAATEALVAAGLSPHRWVALGPTSACETTPGEGARFDTDRWRVDVADDGEALLTNLAPRHTAADRLRTGVPAALLRK